MADSPVISYAGDVEAPPVSVPPPSRRDMAMARVFRLRDIPLFSGLSADELLPVGEIASEATLASGEVVFEEGDPGERFYVITSGRVDVLRQGRTLATLGPGDCFGEMALLDGTTRSATVRALDDCTVLVMTRSDFLDLLELYPGIARAIAAVLIARLRDRLTRKVSSPSAGGR